MQLKLIKPSVVSYAEIEITYGRFKALTSSIFDEEDPIQKLLGHTEYSNCIIESDTELKLGKKFDYQFDAHTYKGIIPISCNDRHYDCAIDCIQ